MERAVITPRPSRPGDEGALRRLWQTVFGDDDAFLDVFFREIYIPGMAFVIEDGGVIAAASYAVPFGAYRYIYAVATHPVCRGRGYGRAVTLAAAGDGPAYLHPAGEDLQRWYADMGFVPVSWRRTTAAPGDLTPLTPAEYDARREALLSGTPHASYSPGILALFGLGGGFYADRDDRLWAIGADGSVQERLPAPAGGEPYIYAIGTQEPLYWGLTLE